jgi:hypothetical protein
MDIYMPCSSKEEEEEEKAKNNAYMLMVSLGEIQNELENQDGEPVTLKEIDQLYNTASEVNEYFENKVAPEEKKFYILDADYIPADKTHNDLSNAEFIVLVKKHGWTLTAEQLAAEISEDGNYCPVPQTHFVRYI